MRRSSAEFEVAKEPSAIREQFLDELGTPLARQGFGPKDFAESYLVFERRYIPPFAWILLVLVIPIGILALIFWRDTATLFVEFEEASNLTRIKIDGRATRRVWSLIREWGPSTEIA
jgi:hypothetical protein